MTEPWSLRRTEQCGNCPWKRSSQLSSIPGYSRDYHESLRNTIVDPEDIVGQLATKKLRIMACHDDHEAHCLGWLHNQVNQGGNIKLRGQLLSCQNAGKIRVHGEQCDDFDEMLRN